MGAKTSKRYSFLKSHLNPFKLGFFFKFLLSGPHKSTVLNFWNFHFLIFLGFSFLFLFFFSLTWAPMGAKISKRYSSLKSLLNLFNLFLNFLRPLQKSTVFLDIWNFEFPIFSDFFFFNFTIVPYGETKNLKRATVERNRVKFGPRGWVFTVHRIFLTLQCLRSF